MLTRQQLYLIAKLKLLSLWDLTICILCLRSRLMGFAALGAAATWPLCLISPWLGAVPFFGFVFASYYITRKKKHAND